MRMCGFTLTEFLVAITVLAAASAALLTPFLREARLKSNEASAVAALRSVAAAEEVFHAQDFDHNGVHDYWAADLAGLRPLLADARLADADTFPEGGFPPRPIPFNGYWFQALNVDEQGDPYGRTNVRQYGYGAIPVSYNKSGNYCCIVNNLGRVARRDFGPMTVSVSPGSRIAAFSDYDEFMWPDAACISPTWAVVP